MIPFRKKLIKKILSKTMPSFQATSKKDQNIGFGFIFYGFVRTLRPKNICVIGSKAGFSPICFALGLKDNIGSQIKKVECWDTILENTETGNLFFIDPSFSGEKGDKDHWYGIGFWDDKNKTRKHWKKFGVENIITHYKMTSADFLVSKDCPKNIDLLYIDGNHSYSGIMHDFNEYYEILSENAVIIAHDVDPELKKVDPETGGYQVLQDLDKNKFEIFRLPVFPGLAIIRKKML